MGEPAPNPLLPGLMLIIPSWEAPLSPPRSKPRLHGCGTRGLRPEDLRASGAV